MLINSSLFKEKIPQLNPLSIEYRLYWKEQRRRCIEGHWIGGVYMPGVVYQYINIWKIELNKTENSKQKVIAHPFLRDLEWEKGRIYMEARGFSAFEDDTEYHCNRELKDEYLFYDQLEQKRITPYNEDELNKFLQYNRRYNRIEYISPREYLQRDFGKSLGKPIMFNHAKNIVDIESRGGGKSFFASNCIAHNFLHDGVFNYDDLFSSEDKPKSETLVGAIDTKYSNGLLQKVKLGLNNMPGGLELGEKFYPPPLLKQFSGSWESGKTIIAQYEQKIGDTWVKKGSKSMIHHRSFKDNPMAANGTRPGLVALEEIGFMGNLEESLGQLKECTMDGPNKFGTIWMFGTGGDMAGGSTEAVKKVFYDPESFDCLVFDDEYENKGKIGYFVPAWKTLNKYKDKESGVTNKDISLNYLLGVRKKLSEGKSKQPLYDELQNRPIKPSEAFLVLQGNIFPVAELKEHLVTLEGSDKLRNLGTNGWMFRDDKGKPLFKPDHDLRAADYPTKNSQDPKGAVVIWEEPNTNIQFGDYIAGIDPYDQDKATSSVSYGSIFIYKRFIDVDQTFHLPVAEYTGRPDSANDFYEQCRRLLEWYECKALYENQNTGIKQYLQTKNSLHLLHQQPSIIKSIVPNSKVERTYGLHMPKPIKDELEIKCRDWLKHEVEPGILQLTKIYSIPLLKELIAYNSDGNFDRVIAFMLCIIQDLEMHNIQREEVTVTDTIDRFFTRNLFI